MGARCTHISLVKRASLGISHVLRTMFEGRSIESHINSRQFERHDDKGVRGVELAQDSSAFRQQDRSMIRKH